MDNYIFNIMKLGVIPKGYDLETEIKNLTTILLHLFDTPESMFNTISYLYIKLTTMGVEINRARDMIVAFCNEGLVQKEQIEAISTRDLMKIGVK